MIKNKTLLIFCIIIFLLGLFARIYAINLKQDLHLDEALSVLLSNYSDFGWVNVTETNKFYTGKELKQLAYWNDSSIKDTLTDIKNLYIYTRDDPHTNFYYSFLRLVNNGVDEFDLKETILKGGHLNIIFYMFSFFYMFKLLNLLLPKNLIPLGLLAAFINPATISNTVFLRPYQLQETLFILFTYVFVKFYLTLKNDNPDLSGKNSVIIAITIALTFLTGYYAAIYIGILALIIIITAWKKKDKTLTTFLTKTALLSIFFTCLFYPVYFLGFFTYRVVDTAENFINFGENIKSTLIAYPMILLTHLFSWLIIFYLIYLKIKFPQRQKSNIPLLFTIGILWSFLVTFIAPYKDLRYIMPIIPILSLIIPYFLIPTDKKILHTAFLAFILSLNVFIGFSFHKKPQIGNYIPFIAKIEFLKTNKIDHRIFSENTVYPVYIVKQQPNMSMGEILQISNILPYLEDNQKYAYIEISDIKNIKSKHFYVLIPKFPKSEYPTRSIDFYTNYTRIKIQDCSKFYSCIEFKH